MKGGVTLNHQILYPIIRRLEEHHIPYSLGGSGLMVALNLVDAVQDWDMTVDCSKDTLIQAIEGIDWIEQRSGDRPFASGYRISIPSLSIDFIGNFALYSGEQIVYLPVHTSGMWEGIRLSSPEIYLMGRREKADLLLKYMQTNREMINVALLDELLTNKEMDDELRQGLERLIL